MAVGVLGLSAIFVGHTWWWWQSDPKSTGTATNAMWLRHQWVGEKRTEADYQALVTSMRQNKITDAYFHAGPLEPDGSVPEAKYEYADELTAAFRKLAPEIRTQAYLGQIRRQSDGSGLLPLDDPKVREGIVQTARDMLKAGFHGIHYDIEPIYYDDTAFLDLLDRTRKVTSLLSVSLEQLTMVDAAQPVYRAVLPRGGGLHYPARPTEAYLEQVADKVDQVAIMAYDTMLPSESLVGKHFARHTERTLELIGDRTTVFLGVPTYRTSAHWSEDLRVSIRGVKKGLDALDHEPKRPYGLAIYPEWTTSATEWEHYRQEWADDAR